MVSPIERSVPAPVPEPAAAGATEPEPVTPEPPRRVRRPPLLTQSWLDLAFLHWEADPGEVARLLPRGAVPDLFEGRAYVGLIAFRMHRIGWLGLPGLPWIGSFPETNVRLYSVGADGRRGVVFRSLEASRLVPVMVARAGFRLPYVWARMSVVRSESPDGGPTFTYTSRRLPPGRRDAVSDLAIRVGEPVDRPSGFEHFVTARWGLHLAPFGPAARYLPNEHGRWPLHRAELLDCRETLISAAGLTAPSGPPASVLYSPGVSVRFGPTGA
ncbi:MAG TPA: DUF2071 domain-containing protein [Actinocrinis sp.]|jgi:hypothetical protein